MVHTITCYSYQANLLEIIRTLDQLDQPYFSQLVINLGTIYMKDTFCNKLPSFS